MKLKETQQLYKIRDKETGLFSLGGMRPSFSKSGKTWASRGALKSHLTQLQQIKQDSKFSCDRYEVVEYVFTLQETNSWPILDEFNRVPKK